MSRMYDGAKTWNPAVGCLYDCVYCFPSFRRQLSEADTLKYVIDLLYALSMIKTGGITCYCKKGGKNACCVRE